MHLALILYILSIYIQKLNKLYYGQTYDKNYFQFILF